MLRTVGTLIGVMAVATLITEGIVFAFYWSQGGLNPQSLQDIRMIMQGQDPVDLFMEEEEEKKETETPSYQDISVTRATRLVGLHQQFRTLDTINESMVSRAKKIEMEEKKLKTERTKFQEEVDELMERITSEAILRGRGIIQAMKPAAEKVNYLMELDVETCVILIKEMDDKEIAKILKAFSDSNQVEAQERGKLIFMEINKGEPVNRVAQKAQRAARVE